MAVGLTGPGPDSQNQKHIVCRQFSERGSCSFGDRCKFFHDASIRQGSQIPTAGVPPRRQNRRELHVELLVGFLVAEPRRRFQR